MSHKSFTGRTFGDIGDAICCVPIARALGSMGLYAQNHAMCKSILSPARFNAIKPLLESSPYIEFFEPYNGEDITHDMATFREGGILFGENLSQLHAKWINIEISEEPWIEVDPDPAFDGCIVVNRSTRHHNSLMDWKPILEHYEKDLVFLGLPEECQQLINETGIKIKRHATTDLLQCARIINASRAFLGNQSALLNVSIALGKKFLSETSLTSLDTIYKRDAFYCLDGSVEDFEVDGYEPLNVKSRVPQIEVDFHCSPPKQRWIITDLAGNEHRDFSARKVIQAANAIESSFGLHLSTYQDLANQMTERYPEWNPNNYVNCLIRSIETARKVIAEKQNSR